jgi:hypothetical protein
MEIVCEEIIYDFADYKIKKLENELSFLSKSQVFLLKDSIEKNILLLKELGSSYYDVLSDHMELISTKIDNYFHMLDVQKMREEINNRIVQLTVDIECESDGWSGETHQIHIKLESFIREKFSIDSEMKVLEKFGANENEMNELKYLFDGISLSLERFVSKIVKK